MKHIIQIQTVANNGNVTIDGNNPIFINNTMEQVLDKWLPYTRLFENIFVKNFTYIPEMLLDRLTNQYLHGAKITIEVPKHHQKKMVCVKGFVEPIAKYNTVEPFSKTYQVRVPRKFYSYKWTPLDFNHIPKKLASYPIEQTYTDHTGKKVTVKSTCLDEFKKLKSTKFLPNHLWTALDKYSQERIDKCKEYNKGNYTFAEEWFKELTKDSMQHGFTVYSPCKKTYFESIAELDFEKTFEVLADGEKPLTPQEIDFLYRYAPAYGVDIPQFQFRYNTRLTDHGYTEEIERVYENGCGETELNRMRYDPKNPNCLPSFARQNLAIKSYENDKLLRDAYNHLKYLIDTLGDTAFDIRYHRCPKCNDIFHEERGCDCGYCPPIKEIPADRLFYGHSSEFEDLVATKGAYDELMYYYHSELEQDN